MGAKGEDIFNNRAHFTPGVFIVPPAGLHSSEDTSLEDSWSALYMIFREYVGELSTGVTPKVTKENIAKRSVDFLTS